MERNSGEKIDESYSVRRRTRCPYCWNDFATEDVLWIAESSDLFGDVRLGENAKERFLPIQFDASGAAIDRAGFPCRRLACPFCHLEIPRSYFETEPFFFSIAGAPFSGKSYFLTSAIWNLRRTFSVDFDVVFSDSSPDLNARLIEDEKSQFMRRDGETIPKLQKTQELGDSYQSVLINRQETRYLKPFLFSARLKSDSAAAKKDDLGAATIALYDNAGESFLPAAGSDDASAPVTRHLGRSDALIFLFDPTQDSRFLPARIDSERKGKTLSESTSNRKENEVPSGRNVESGSVDAFGFPLDEPTAFAAPKRETGAPSAPKPNELEVVPNVRQELVFTEALKRIRENLGIDFRTKYDKPLIVVLSKFDVWKDAASDVSIRNPWARTTKGVPCFLLDRVRDVSDAARVLLKKYLPEFVAQAEDFASDVVYIPVSATGEPPFFDEKTGEWRFDPAGFRPIWAETPILFALAKAKSGLIPFVKGE